MVPDGTVKRKLATRPSEQVPLLEQRILGNKELLQRWDELPRWQQEDNHFIETGYRPASGSLVRSFKSWTYLHNESVNIYTHILGSLIFFILPFYIFRTEIPPRYRVATPADLLVFSIYFLGVAICFLLSTTFHTIMNHSPRIEKIGVQLDFQGVILLMWGATVPLIYYGFYCDRTLQVIYWSLSSTLATACSITTFQPRFSDPFLRPVRAATFGSLAIASILPAFHGVIKYSWEIQSQRLGLGWVGVTLVLNGAGAGAYAMKFPERWFRRKFDIWGASHQLLHVLVVGAGLTHTVAILRAFDYAHRNLGQCAGL